MKQQPTRVAAVIEIGSNAVRLRVAEWNGVRMNTLDQLEKPVHIGHEVFTTGRIGFEALRELSDILAGFSDAAREYGVERPRVIATTAFREADNRAHVLDHLRIRNRMDVEVLEENEVNSVIFSEMMRHMDDLPPKLFLVYAGTGSIGVAACDAGKMVFTQSLHTGSLKIADMLRAILTGSRRIDQAVEEYLAFFMDYVSMVHDFSHAHALAICCHDSEFIAALCAAGEIRGIPAIDSRRLLDVWDEIKTLTPNQLAARHAISPERGEHLYANLAIHACFARLTGASHLMCPRVEMIGSRLTLLLHPGTKRAYEESLRSGALASALAIARRYRCRIRHAQYVARVAVTLFERLRKIHGLSWRQCTLLEAACLMHEIGYFANARESAFVTYAMIRDACIYGMGEHDLDLVAEITHPIDNAHGPERAMLSVEDRLFAAKMHALMRMADALDYSCRQKAAVTGVDLKRSRLIVTLAVCGDYALEEWAFAQVAPLFEDAFGLKPQMDIERVSG